MLVPVPELAAARACGDMLIPVVKECSAWGLGALGACLVLPPVHCLRAAPWRCCSPLAQGFGILKKSQTFSSRATWYHSVWDLEAHRVGIR